MQLIGHRGVCSLHPENTLLSIKQAIAHGLQIIEIDIHQLEGHLVVIHDSSVDRTTNGKGALSSFTLFELQKLDAGNGEQIPTLQQVLTILPPEVTLNIEIKGKQCIPALTSILQKTSAKIVISSFDWNQLIELRSHHKSIPIAILTDGKEPWSIAEQLDAIAVNPSIKQVDSKFVEKAHCLGLQVWCYTAKDTEQLNRLTKLNVDACFVDDPTI